MAPGAILGEKEKVAEEVATEAAKVAREVAVAVGMPTTTTTCNNHHNPSTPRSLLRMCTRHWPKWRGELGFPQGFYRPWTRHPAHPRHHLRLCLRPNKWHLLLACRHLPPPLPHLLPHLRPHVVPAIAIQKLV